MKSFEEGSKKIEQICELLKKDAIEPARKEAEAIIEQAKSKAQQMINEAEQQAEKLQKETKALIEQEKNVFQSFMAQAARQTIESIKQAFEKKFFNEELQQLVTTQAKDPKVIAKFIEVIVKAIEKEGITSDLSAVVPQNVSKEEINGFIGENTLKKLKEQSVVLGGFSGGVQVKLHNKKMTIDVSDKALIDILSSYRKGFRELFFQS